MRPAARTRNLHASLRWLFSRLAREEASTLVEFAVALPLLAVLVVGIFDFGGALNLKQKLNNAAREGARFAANLPGNDLSRPAAANPKDVPQGVAPDSVDAVADLVGAYLAGGNVNTCGLNAGPRNVSKDPTLLVWTYTANTGCPGTLTLVIDRGFTYPAGSQPITVEATRIQVQYPYKWAFNSVITLLVPGSTGVGTTTISSDAVQQNLN